MQQCQRKKERKKETNKLYERHRQAKQATCLQQKCAKVGPYTTLRTSGEVCKSSEVKLLLLVCLKKEKISHVWNFFCLIISISNASLFLK
jgi:hypothetical protein